MITIINGRYSHLYASATYEVPSVKRTIEGTSVNEGDKFGNVRIANKHSSESMTGQSKMDYLIDKNLRNKDLYRNMKDKILYSMDSGVISHSILNNL